MKALRAGDDDKVADAYVSRMEKAIAKIGYRPTTDDGNATKEADDEQGADYLPEMLKGIFGSSSGAAAGAACDGAGGSGAVA